MKTYSSLALSGAVLSSLASVQAIQLDASDSDSYKSAAATAAEGLMSYYKGNESGEVPGLLPEPYFWGDAGAMFGGLIDYWYLTGDDSYNDLTTQAMLFQVGESQDYMPANQSFNEGNDDQCMWGLTAMQAAESGFKEPTGVKIEWLDLAQNVFNRMSARWDPATCDGGLRWQYNPTLNGFDYKNALSNGCFFNLASRLGKHTGNKTYLEWADKTYQWVTDIGLITDDYHVYDGADVEQGCKNIHKTEFSVNAGVFLHGSAVMFNATNALKWRQATIGHGTAILKQFFHEDVISETACEPSLTCDKSQTFLKGLLVRFVGAAIRSVPWVSQDIVPILAKSAIGAAKQCSGKTKQAENVCGERWYEDSYDGTSGVGQQLSAMEIFQNTMQFPQSGSNTGGGDTGDNSTETTGGGDGGDENDDDTGDDTGNVDDDSKEDGPNMASGNGVGLGLLALSVVIGIFGLGF